MWCFSFLQRLMNDTSLRKIHSELRASGSQANPSLQQDSGSAMALNSFFTVTPRQEKATRLYFFDSLCAVFSKNYNREFKYLNKWNFLYIFQNKYKKIKIKTATWHQSKHWLTQQLLWNRLIFHRFSSHSKIKPNAAQRNARTRRGSWYFSFIWIILTQAGIH